LRTIANFQFVLQYDQLTNQCESWPVSHSGPGDWKKRHNSKFN